MEDKIYKKIKEAIATMPFYQEIKNHFTTLMLKGKMVGITQQEITKQDKEFILLQDFKGLILSKSKYASFLIYLTALEAVADEFKSKTGFASYTDVIYIPYSKKERAIMIEKEMLNGLHEEEIEQWGRRIYDLEEEYMLESEIELEINRMIQKSIYQKVYVASKLKIRAGMSG